MKPLAFTLSMLGLLGTVLPPLLFWTGHMTLPAVKSWMLAATVVWFVATPFWMEHQLGD